MTRLPAAGRRGFFPGDDLSEMPSGGRQIRWLKISRIIGYREYLHDPQTGTSHDLLTGGTYQDRYTRAAWAELTRSLKEEGFREPLKLEYEPDSRHAYLGEGNHRLVAAGLAGYTAVLVWGLRGHASERMRQARRVPGEPELKRENGRGYFPSSFRPSDGFPAATFTRARTRSSATGAPRNSRATRALSTSPRSTRPNGAKPGSVTPACARPIRSWPREPPPRKTRTRSWTSLHGCRCHPAGIPEPRSSPVCRDRQPSERLDPRGIPGRGGYGDPGRGPADAATGRQRRRGLGGAADRLGPGRRGMAGLARRAHRRSPGRPAHAPVQRTMGHQPGPLAYRPGMARHAHHPGRADHRRAGICSHHGRGHRVADHRRTHPQARRPGRRARRQPAGCCSATSSGHPAAAPPCSPPGKTPSPRSCPARARRPR